MANAKEKKKKQKCRNEFHVSLCADKNDRRLQQLLRSKKKNFIFQIKKKKKKQIPSATEIQK